MRQRFDGTQAEKKAKQKQVEEQQKLRPVIKCHGKPLINTFLFRYLGSIFAADGSMEHDVARRIGIASTRAGQLRHVMGSQHIPMETKLKIYNAAVVSLFTYGCEGWTLTPKLMRRLNDANSRLLAHISNKTIVEEAREITTSFNLIKEIRKRRLCWAGHILRLDEDRLVRRALVEQFEAGEDGAMVMDAPTGNSIEQLTALALDDNKRTWKNMVKNLV